MKPEAGTQHTRLLGFDLLRGLCAVGVAFYHVMAGQGAGIFENLGLYGVYIFFVLSGASMVVAYKRKFEAGLGMADFIMLRFFRLAPLYWLIVILSVLYKHDFSAEVLWNAVLNVTFLFGFANPGHSSVVTGGWSLGIEFLFYFLFPVFLALADGKMRAYLIAALLLVLQLAFVQSVIRKTGDVETNWAVYTQFISFIGYFFAGCLMGRVFLAGTPLKAVNGSVLWVGFIGLLAILALCNTGSQEAALMGWRGVALPLVAIGAVFLAGNLPVPARLVSLAQFFGAMSYGLYLLHPKIYKFLSVWGATKDMGAVAMGACVIALSGALAVAIWHLYETPVKNFGYRRFAPKR